MTTVSYILFKKPSRPKSLIIISLLSAATLLSSCGHVASFHVPNQEFEAPDVPGSKHGFIGGAISSSTKFATINDTRLEPPISSGNDTVDSGFLNPKVNFGIFEAVQVSADFNSLNLKWQIFGHSLANLANNEYLASLLFKYEHITNHIRDDYLNIFGGSQTITESDLDSEGTGFGIILGYRIDQQNTVYLMRKKSTYSVRTEITQELTGSYKNTYIYHNDAAHEVTAIGYRYILPSRWLWGIEASHANGRMDEKRNSSYDAGFFLAKQF